MTQVPVWHHPPAAGGPRVIGVRVSEASAGMEARGVHAGDTVWVDPDQRSRRGDLVLVQRPDGNFLYVFEQRPTPSKLVGPVTLIGPRWRDVVQ